MATQTSLRKQPGDGGAFAASPLGQQGSPPLVLVAEDHEDTRFLLRVLLETRGLCVIEASDGEEALRVAEQARPSLVLMDGGLPRLDGFTATRLMRASASLC